MPGESRLYLPLSVPVYSIVVGALEQLEEVGGLDRDEAYLLTRLKSAHEEQRTAALLTAIEEAPDG